ncbi:YciI family protein [Pantoea sp. Nvir]|uniref:YciI family protein n=1 Tax=Pantoea sp. Nvir TaxID=2576760 RepID=UPI00135C75EC|nr:YciI family protein [Pantoea sp. Nvir]MXP66693.1 YciI family protein [Pantoea sp. Nvir]CAJ0991819.1 Protein YciI [Pantoea sp. Nvir]
MLYIIYTNKDNTDSLGSRQSEHLEHLARLQLLRNEGRLIVAGEMPAVDSSDPGLAGFIGSAIIAEFGSLETAQSWVTADSYIAAEVYKNVVVRPFKRIF